MSLTYYLKKWVLSAKTVTLIHILDFFGVIFPKITLILGLKLFFCVSICSLTDPGAEILRACSSNTICHVSHVTCPLSHVNFFFFIFYPLNFFDKVVELVGGGYVINGAYPVQFNNKKYKLKI